MLTLCGGILMTGISKKADYAHFYTKIVASAWRTPAVTPTIMWIHSRKLAFYLSEVAAPVGVLVIGVYILIHELP